MVCAQALASADTPNARQPSSQDVFAEYFALVKRQLSLPPPLTEDGDAAAAAAPAGGAAAGGKAGAAKKAAASKAGGAAVAAAAVEQQQDGGGEEDEEAAAERLKAAVLAAVAVRSVTGGGFRTDRTPFLIDPLRRLRAARPGAPRTVASHPWLTRCRSVLCPGLRVSAAHPPPFAAQLLLSDVRVAARNVKEAQLGDRAHEVTEAVLRAQARGCWARSKARTTSANPPSLLPPLVAAARRPLC